MMTIAQARARCNRYRPSWAPEVPLITLYKAVARGALPARRWGNQIGLRAVDVDAWHRGYVARAKARLHKYRKAKLEPIGEGLDDLIADVSLSALAARHRAVSDG